MLENLLFHFTFPPLLPPLLALQPCRLDCRLYFSMLKSHKVETGGGGETVERTIEFIDESALMQEYFANFSEINSAQVART